LTRRGKGLTAAAAVLLAVGAGAAYWRWSASALPPAPTAAELEALTKKRDELQARVRELVREKGEANLAAAPPGGVMIGIPVSLTEDIAGQIVSGVFRETTLVLRNLKVHKEGEVRAKLLFRKKTLGNFVLDVDIQEAIGQLRPAPPRISIDRGRFTVALGVGRRPREGVPGLQVGQPRAGGERGLRRSRRHPRGHRTGRARPV
jgi:hypothetical protein